ncbi:MULTISPECIES: hypothetical protein [Streptomyces]|uniref:Lipoprotein n=1 Tax=Streptomyces fimbriatus TaxID=68197 RepID=A0ABW0DHR1_STRFI
MRYKTAVVASALAALVTGCSGGSENDDKPLDQLQAERDARESAVPSLKDVRTCTVLVTGRINTGWRQTTNTDVTEDQLQASRDFDRTYLPGSPEYDSFNQRFQEGLPTITQQITTGGRDREEVLLEQTAEVTEFVKQDCTVAYKR